MSGTVELVIVVGALTLTGVVGCLSAMAGQLYERRRWERKILSDAGFGPESDKTSAAPRLSAGSRFDQLEQAVDAIAQEVERVGEGQRFVTKLLAERKISRTPPSPIPGGVRPAP